MWELDYKENWVRVNWCFWTVVFEKTLKNALDCKNIPPAHPKGIVLNIHQKGWCWSWNSNTLPTWCEELTHWKRPWCWERLKAGEEGDDRGWDGLMESPTRWTWVWASSRYRWWTGKPGVLQFLVLQRVGHDWTELKWPRGKSSKFEDRIPLFSISGFNGGHLIQIGLHFLSCKMEVPTCLAQ